MNRLFKLAATATLICCPMKLGAQYQTIELADVQLTKSLSATVQDPTGAPVRNAVVEEFDTDWKTALRSGSTDNDGKFFVYSSNGPKNLFHSGFRTGFDPLRFRLQVDAKHGASLRLKLTLAT
jgi:hypothetical protein